ncbi:MAG: peptide/nickel transport system substrate-binding protein [Rhodospirillaceae bacterium]|nr:peptide/nickel transport system substrate-binding protein [Rhodospirillaceae bacterium]
MSRLKHMLLAALAVAGSALLTPAFADSQPKQGGSIVVTFKDDLATLDPAIGYDWQNWSIIKSIYSGLMDYEPGTTKLMPDLAESYAISDDGLTYTFKLRPNLKFHNGRAVTSADVKYSIERAVNPKTQCPGAGYFNMISGYDEEAAGKTTTLSGIATPDDHTVVFTLARPDATFLHIMAINFGFVVPKEEVEKYGTDFGHHPVGTGAFKFGQWQLGQKLVLERNKDYHRAGVPYADEITFEFGQEPTVALLRLQKGEVDILGDGIPPAQFLQVTSNPANKSLYVQGEQMHTGYVTLNLKVKPFDDLKVRQAVNMAINKKRIIQIINGRAQAANQVLPPTLPGYAKDYQGYPYDPAKAKALLAEAGYPKGFSTELYTTGTDPQPRIAQAIQRDLAGIGVKADIKSLSGPAVIEAGGTEGQAPMVWSGGLAWIADFPDPSNFYTVILGCAGAVKGGWNWSWYCNPELDKRAKAADAMVSDADQGKRAEAWKGIFIDAMKDAPWIPIMNERRYTMHSERVGGDPQLFIEPIHIPVNYVYIYAKDAQ